MSTTSSSAIMSGTPAAPAAPKAPLNTPNSIKFLIGGTAGFVNLFVELYS